MKLVFVRWLDAGSDFRRWYTAGDLDVRCEIQSAGILVSESKDVLSFAMDYDKEGNQFRDVTSIPTSTIIEKRYFNLPEKKGAKS